MDYLYLVLALLAGGAAQALPLDADAHWALIGNRPLLTAFYLNLGALLAVLAFCWRSVGIMGQGIWRFLKGKHHPGSRLTGLVLMAALPGILAEGFLASHLALSPLAVGLASLAFVLLALVLDKLAMTVKRLEHLTLGGSLFVGLMAALSIIPGVGRAGAVILAARLLGFERADAFRLTLLVTIPVLAVGLVAQGWKLGLGGGLEISGALLGLALGAFLTTLALCALLLSWLREHSLLPVLLWRAGAAGALVGISLGVF